MALVLVLRSAKCNLRPALRIGGLRLLATADESGFVIDKEYQRLLGGGYRMVKDESIFDYDTSAAILANSIRGSSYEGTVGGPRADYDYRELDNEKPILDYETSASILMRSLEGSRYEGTIGGPRVQQPIIDFNKPLFDYESTQILLSRHAAALPEKTTSSPR